MSAAEPHDHDLYTFFDALAIRWDAQHTAARDDHLARLLAPHHALFDGVRHVVDVGTGTGAFLPHLDRLAPQARVTALDLSSVMLAHAQASGRTCGVCCWLRADAHALPLASGQADLVTCHDSFAHFERPAQALAEFRRVLAPGGALLILHDISREHVAHVHHATGHPRIQAHVLPPACELAPLVTAAGFIVLAAIDAPDHYLITARVCPPP
ncbi:MAG: methyltransferase domain-containing protein [Chloroflexi bacterium]|nr:methyltransferase domain-containing protein [Chloroflexota bacterium]